MSRKDYLKKLFKISCKADLWILREIPEPGGIDNNLHKRENNSVVLVKVGEQMKKNENVENYESWSIEIIEQQKRHSDMLTCALVISLIVNVILVAMLAVVVKG